MVCRPTKFCGLGISDLEKFATSLRIRWLWIEWTDKSKTGFALVTLVIRRIKTTLMRQPLGMLVTGKAKFWNSPWLSGIRPKDIAPKIFKLTKQKNISVKKALDNNFFGWKVDT
jgi:hypothetical protein